MVTGPLIGRKVVFDETKTPNDATSESAVDQSSEFVGGAAPRKKWIKKEPPRAYLLQVSVDLSRILLFPLGNRRWLLIKKREGLTCRLRC